MPENSELFRSLNSFNFESGSIRDAIRFHHEGHNEGGYEQIPTGNDITTLQTGGPNYKHMVLLNAGVNVYDFEIYNNTYNNEARRLSYTWDDLAGNFGGADIYNAFYQIRFTYNFEADYGNPDGWNIVEYPNDTDVYTTDYLPLEGERSTVLMDNSSSYMARMSKAVNPSISRGYYRAWINIQSHNSDVYPLYTLNPGESIIYWVIAGYYGSWKNSNTVFSGSWNTGTWYFLEVEFDFSKDKYTVWISNDRIAHGVDIPTSSASVSGDLYMAPASNLSQGTMKVDFVRLAAYED